jgi:hypothetical protein
MIAPVDPLKCEISKHRGSLTPGGLWVNGYFSWWAFILRAGGTQHTKNHLNNLKSEN